jgi:hypothetical protein
MPAKRIASGAFRSALFPRISPYLGSRFTIGHARCLCWDHQLFFGLNLYLTENTVWLLLFFKSSSLTSARTPQRTWPIRITKSNHINVHTSQCEICHFGPILAKTGISR